ncbi:hypothetical protein [Tistrella mobilis]
MTRGLSGYRVTIERAVITRQAGTVYVRARSEADAQRQALQPGADIDWQPVGHDIRDVAVSDVKPA